MNSPPPPAELVGVDAAVRLFAHLEALLPLRNPSGEPDHAVIRYAEAELRALGRAVQRDAQGNLYSPPQTPGVDSRPPRAIVAHTDSVLQGEGDEWEPFDFTGGIYRSRHLLRPLGGDDKCGVAVALTLAYLLPEVACILPADEEEGFLGALVMDVPRQELMVECDRRGERQVVYAMIGPNDNPMRVASPEATLQAWTLLPWREPVAGGGTDVGAFVARGLARNAFNLSVGYFDPHTPGEFIVASAVLDGLHDAFRLLKHLPQALPAVALSPLRTA